MVKKKYIYMNIKENKMNKKGFAISTMLYGLVFVTIAVFYLILAIVGKRNDSKDNYVQTIREQLQDSFIIKN